MDDQPPEIIDKGARRQFVATASMVLLNIRWTSEIYLESLKNILRNEPTNVNFLGQKRRTDRVYRLVTRELEIRKVLVPYDEAQTMELCERYDRRHWNESVDADDEDDEG
jgi:hypothetical protein